MSNSKLYRNLILVFLFSGLWHGASWNFVLWGAYHGLFLVLERLFLGNVFAKLGKFISVPLTFIIVITGWVLFRNEDLSYATGLIKQMYSFEFFHGKFAINNDFIAMAILASLISFFAFTSKTKHIQDRIYGEKFTGTSKWAVLFFGIVLYYVSLTYVSALNFNPFIYFRF